jgi:outer membrane protein OmpA-like peptidoglycan-associated protein
MLKENVGSVAAMLFVGFICLSASGCQAHGKASAKFDGSASLSGKAEVTADASANVDAESTGLSSRIRLEGDRLEYEGDINFKYNDDALEGDETFQTLGQLRDILRKHEEVHLHVEGHADSRGRDDDNLKLSDRRAGSVRGWLVKNGIDEDRLTAEGYGEDQKEKEPEHCRDKTGPDRLFEDQDDCLAKWAENRRTVFKVTTGLETLRPEAPKAAPPPEPAPKREAAEKTCRWPVGFHLNLLGPNSYGGVAIATEPCVWWLELSLGVGYREGSVEDTVDGQDVSGDFTAWTVPFRGRFWFSPERSSFLVDAGVGVAMYEITGRDAAGNQNDLGGSYRRPIGSLGIGYGYRSGGPFRLALLVGGLMHAQPLDTFGELSDPRPYGEASFGFLF